MFSNPLFAYYADTQYLHQNKLDSETRTRIVPLPDTSLRVKRDANSTEQDIKISTSSSTKTPSTTTTTEGIVSKPLTPAVSSTTDELDNELSKVLTASEDEVNKNLHTHGHEDNFAFDNVSREQSYCIEY